MPYIKKELRVQLDEDIDNLIETVIGVAEETPDDLDGVLNYCFTKICKRLYPKKYHWYNRMIGMLECCKLEMYRNVIGPYESSKAIENGDVE